MLGMGRKPRAEIYDFWTAQETENSFVAILTGSSLTQTLDAGKCLCQIISLGTLKDSEGSFGDSCHFLTEASWLVPILKYTLVVGAFPQK
jgi:hypothetical protein